MQDFESKEFRSYVFSANDEMDVSVDMKNVQLAEVELDQDLLLSVHRC